MMCLNVRVSTACKTIKYIKILCVHTDIHAYTIFKYLMYSEIDVIICEYIKICIYMLYMIVIKIDRYNTLQKSRSSKMSCLEVRYRAVTVNLSTCPMHNILRKANVMISKNVYVS